MLYWYVSRRGSEIVYGVRDGDQNKYWLESTHVPTKIALQFITEKQKMRLVENFRKQKKSVN